CGPQAGRTALCRSLRPSRAALRRGRDSTDGARHTASVLDTGQHRRSWHDSAGAHGATAPVLMARQRRCSSDDGVEPLAEIVEELLVRERCERLLVVAGRDELAYLLGVMASWPQADDLRRLTRRIARQVDEWARS